MKLRKSRENRDFNIKEILGDGVSIKESKKSLARKDREFFVNLVSALIEIDNRTEMLLELGVDLILYEDPYHNIMESFIFKHYGPVKAEIVMWWLSEKMKKGNKSITLQGVGGNDYPINTPKQLYDALKKVEKI